ncbi:hypothetical protein SAMN05216359_103146 [Roseateles sp. YR242]|uniref:protein-tyrosine phosphatase family protein n=1 Tax=Roseateles sp. YR242 TaxID=1855305 RepID=UPI0008C799A5|nr:protein-tyrosine phosphatase family protein [Roseateles sp. YR242]SEK80433.1 hypothetical protein SAMN05216359_103146 [Roseateles sp. YR242]
MPHLPSPPYAKTGAPALTSPVSPRRRQLLAGLALSPWLAACGGGSDDNDGANASSAANDQNGLAEVFQAEAIESGSLNPSLVHQLAEGDGTPHRVFRGNAPIANGQFEYDALVSALRAKAPTPLPERFQLVVVSLLNSIGDRANLEVERAFWSANPSLGRLVNHPIFGALSDPASLPAAVRRQLERLPGLDRMGSLLNDIHALLQAPVPEGGLPQMIFVHCQAGKDRTGQVSASYRLRYQGRSYKNALEESRTTAGRDIERYSRYGLKWYAYDQQDFGGIPTIGPID